MIAFGHQKSDGVMRIMCLTRIMRHVHILPMTLDQYLCSAGLSESALAEQVGCSPSSINRLRRGLTKPDWKMCERLVEVTRGSVTPNDFLASSQTDSSEAAE